MGRGGQGDRREMRRSIGVRCMQTESLIGGAPVQLPSIPPELREWNLSPIAPYREEDEPRCKCRRIDCDPERPPSPPSPPPQPQFGDFEPLPLLEMQEKDQVWTGEVHPPMYQEYLGQLRLAVYVNYGLLTVHVMRAKNLHSNRSLTCDPFVKVALIPGEDERSRCETDTVYDTNDPLFDEKFSFELMDEDMKKRVLVSVWHQDQYQEPELLGCMSFGIKHIYSLRRTVNGWYFLLSESVGKRKHLHAVCKKPPKTKHGKSRKHSSEKQLLWMDPYTIVVRRRDTGFGFTFGGWSPAQILKVERGSAAETSGLQPGDWLMRINGVNVMGSTTDSIARIIKHCHRYMVLDIHRPRKVDLLDDRPGSFRPRKVDRLANPPSSLRPLQGRTLSSQLSPDTTYSSNSSSDRTFSTGASFSSLEWQQMAAYATMPRGVPRPRLQQSKESLIL